MGAGPLGLVFQERTVPGFSRGRSGVLNVGVF
jgi:hypothetical protein